MQPVGLRAHVPLERLQQRRRVLRHGRDAAIGEVHHVGRVRLPLGAREQQPQEVARGLDLGELLLVDADAERLLDPQPQLEPAQAVEAEVALEQAVEVRGDHRRAGAARLGEERVQDVDQGARRLVRRQRRHRVGGDGHALGECDEAAIVIRPGARRVLIWSAH